MFVVGFVPLVDTLPVTSGWDVVRIEIVTARLPRPADGRSRIDSDLRRIEQVLAVVAANLNLDDVLSGILLEVVGRFADLVGSTSDAREADRCRTRTS
ncbi:hypothetical protein D8S78_24195 [Natrialba swarupiae]|nr:hypothetical protein [Natrialba swarupiae]